MWLRDNFSRTLKLWSYDADLPLQIETDFGGKTASRSPALAVVATQVFDRRRRIVGVQSRLLTKSERNRIDCGEGVDSSTVAEVLAIAYGAQTFLPWLKASKHNLLFKTDNKNITHWRSSDSAIFVWLRDKFRQLNIDLARIRIQHIHRKTSVSYTHLRAHET